MPEAARSRISGRRATLALAGGILLLFAFITWRFFATYWPDGPILFEVAEEGDHTLVVRSDERGHVHAVRVHESEGPQWTLSLFGIPSREGVTSEGPLTTMRVIDHEGHLETHAFNRETGEFVWRGGRSESALDEGADAVAHQTLVSDGDQYEFDASAREVICLNRSNGETRWREPLGEPDPWGTPNLREGRLCVRSPNGAGGWCRGPHDASRLPRPSP